MTQHTTSTASGNPDRPHDVEDISSKAFWSATGEERERTFARLRARGTITWHPPMEDSLLDDPEDFGFWAVTTYDDLVEVTRRPDDFLSGPGILMESAPHEFVEAAQSIIGMDPPRHTKMRRLVSAAFTPKQMRRIDDRIAANARTVVDNLLERAEAGGGTAEFVAECAELLPMHNINDMMGVPDGDRQEANREMKVLVGWQDPELVGTTQEERLGRMFQAIVTTHQLCTRLANERREEPQDDLITALVEAEVDGEKLTDADIAAFFCLLTIAGTDTTRQSTSHGLRALTDHPDQRAWLLEDLENRVAPAVEEIVRWATPIMTFRRTAARDLEFRGQQVTAGDKVVMFYSSANRDETRIERPHELDLSRHPNPHVSFGGGGIHHCLGNQLARFQLRALFTELLTRAPHIAAGEPELMPGNFFHVVKRMPAHL
ncbi:cytochrome P450 [Actinomycetospora soli]|uniref:cytochrome P450 n=1 Tax=Actinomycetospora soli TaxID=2893887 RepID=UPI001E45248A|nr:cytochrome P450 [Actinomycetospora soli]MCD2189744.1 cytochrome P450 [Actinomycetospora soli]